MLDNNNRFQLKVVLLRRLIKELIKLPFENKEVVSIQLVLVLANQIMNLTQIAHFNSFKISDYSPRAR